MTMLRCVDLWGEANVMYGEPPVREVRDAIFVPFSTEHAWGVFDQNRKIALESIDVRGASRTPHLADTAWPIKTRLMDDVSETLIYCGYPNPHFGHFLINSLPRFWPFYKSIGEARILCALSFDDMPSHAKAILTKLGITRDKVVTFTNPVTIRKVLVPTPCLLEQYWVYTIFKDLCARIAQDFWTEDEVDSVSRPAYLSKTKLEVGVGRFASEQVVEDIVRSAGIDIVHPQTLSFEEQVRLFSTRRLCLGPTGSAFHTSVFAAPKRRILCYNPAREINANFVLLDKINQNDAEYYYQDGMTYESGVGSFLTRVHASDIKQLGEDLVTLARQRTSWF